MATTCEQHGLATGPDGTCVLCRRALSAPPKQATRRWLGVLLALGAAAGLVVFTAVRFPELPSGAEAPADEETAESGELDVAELAEPPVTAVAIDADSPIADPLPQEFSEETRLAHAERLAWADASNSDASPELPTTESPAPTEPEPVGPRVLIARLDIRMYATEWCPHCERARRSMQSSGISYREYDIDNDESAKLRNKRLNARGSVPTFEVEGEVMVGFSPKNFARLLERAVYRTSGQRIEISFQE